MARGATVEVRPRLSERFGDNLRSARERGGLSQAALGRIAGVSSSEVSRLEAGIREPRLTTIVSLARALDVEGAELVRDLAERPRRELVA